MWRRIDASIKTLSVHSTLCRICGDLHELENPEALAVLLVGGLGF